MTLLLSTLLALPLLAPQQPPLDVVVVTGVDAGPGRDIPAGVLHLGTGGLVDGQAAAAPLEPGVSAHRTAGGVLVRAASVGVRVDFPNGRELFVDRRGRVHTKSGAATLPSWHGVDLVFADGARLAVKPGGSDGRRPMRLVGVEQGGRDRVLWKSSKRVRNARHRRRGGSSIPRSAVTYHCAGDGDVLYVVERRGPIVECERVLCPSEAVDDFPEHRLVILGDPLVRSLRELPRRMPRESIEYPEGPRAAHQLALLAPRLFPRGVLRQAEGVASVAVVPMIGGMKLEVHRRGERDYTLQLVPPRHARPVVEWVCGFSSMLHLVRQDGEQGGNPRYFQRGVVVK